MAEVDEVLQRFRNQVAAREARIMNRVSLANQRAQRTLETSLNKLLRRLELDPNNQGLMIQQIRLRELIRQAEELYQVAAQQTLQTIQTLHPQAIADSQGYIENVARATMGTPPAGVDTSFVKFPEQQLSTLEGYLSPGSPLTRLMGGFGPSVGSSMTTALTDGIALGLNPRVIARNMLQGAKDQSRRMETIARTEVLRVYRETNRQTMKANRDIMRGWSWSAALDKRTCPACWAMHGKIFSVDEPMGSHPNCRCVQLPETKSWKELGFRGNYNEPPTQPRGADIFRNLPESTQRGILGNAAFKAYSNGDVDLDDFVQFTYSPIWGSGISRRSLMSILGKPQFYRFILNNTKPRGQLT